MKKKNILDAVNEQNQDQIYQQMIQPESDIPSDEISKLAITELLDTKKLKTISRVKFEQVPILTKLYLYHDTFGETFTKKLADLVLQLQISTNGLGRRELVQLVQQRNMMNEILPQQKGSKDIFR